MDGIILGCLAAFALIVLFLKSPSFIKKLALKQVLISEILSLVFFFATITSVTQSAAGVLGSFVAGGIWTVFFFLYAGLQSDSVVEGIHVSEIKQERQNHFLIKPPTS